MKLIESVNIKNVFEDATTAMNAMNEAGGGAAKEMVERWGNLEKPVKKYGKVIQDAAGHTEDLGDMQDFLLMLPGASAGHAMSRANVGVVDVGKTKQGETAQSVKDREDW